VLFRDSANDGFHEAIGDTIALSVTPEYLVNQAARQGARHLARHRPADEQGAGRSASCPSAC
jgi:peptidyl-dipeptidase A